MSALSSLEVPKNSTVNNLWNKLGASQSSYAFSASCAAIYEPQPGRQLSGYNFDGHGLEVWVDKTAPTEEVTTAYGTTKTEQVVCGGHTLTLRMLIKNVN